MESTPARSRGFIAAGISRWMRVVRRGEFNVFQSGKDLRRGARAAQPAVPTLAPLIVGNGAQEIRAFEVRPQLVRDVDLGIRDLPQEEVAHAHLAAGANYKIGIRLMIGIQVPGYEFFINLEVLEAPVTRC